MNSKKIFSSNLKNLLHKSGVSRPKIAADLNLSYSNIVNWTTEQAYPSIKNMDKLAQYFHVSKADLVEDHPKAANTTDLSAGMVNIPVIGEIHCGATIDAKQYDIVGHQPFPKEELHKGKRYFFLKCRGDSMKPKIQPGAKVLCEKTPVAESGQVAAVLIDDDDDGTFQCTLKRVHFKHNLIVLTPDNPTYYNRSMIITQRDKVQIAGVVDLIISKP